MTSLVCEDAGYHTDIAVVRSDLRYARPCSEQMIRAHCRRPAPEDAKRFTDLLGDRGRAVLCLQARVDSQDETAVVYSGDYSAKIL